jgi:hypothetical protein
MIGLRGEREQAGGLGGWGILAATIEHGRMQRGKSHVK